MTPTTIRDRYLKANPTSAAAATRAERVLPGGDTRAAGFHLPFPITVERGEGAWLWDLDHNAYVDLAGNYTSLVHGNAYPPAIEAASRAMRDGTAWPARNLYQFELAEAIVDRVASVDQIRFANSGTEAGMLALNTAKVITGRSKVLMARFGYHGSHEAFEYGSFDGRFHVPGTDDTLLATYGDPESFEAVLSEHGAEIAAVFLEPVMGSGGIVDAPPAFYQRVERAARDAGALFVIDEVIAFRLAVGGAQSALGVTPDLTMFGKLIGGGFPVGAVGGKAEHMAVMDPRAPKLFHSGTFNGNPVTMAAGAVSVEHLTDAAIAEMARLAERLDVGLRAAAADAGVPLSVRRVGSLLNIYFSETLPEASLRRQDAKMMGAFHLAGMVNGLYFAPRGMLVISTAMDDAIIDDCIARASLAMGEARDEVQSAG